MTDEEKEKILIEFSEKISNQKDFPCNISDIVSDNFWELLYYDA